MPLSLHFKPLSPGSRCHGPCQAISKECCVNWRQTTTRSNLTSSMQRQMTARAMQQIDEPTVSQSTALNACISPCVCAMSMQGT